MPAFNKDCMDCGEPGKHTHPKFPGDRMCSPCYLAFCEDEVDKAIEQLQIAEIITELRSDHEVLCGLACKRNQDGQED
jgi:hypothetical protein